MSCTYTLIKEEQRDKGKGNDNTAALIRRLVVSMCMSDSSASSHIRLEI